MINGFRDWFFVFQETLRPPPEHSIHSSENNKSGSSKSSSTVSNNLRGLGLDSFEEEGVTFPSTQTSLEDDHYDHPQFYSAADKGPIINQK